MSYYQDTSFLSRRAVAFVAIIALHILAIWAFANGMVGSGVRYVQTILQTNIIQTEKQKDLPPPPPPVELKERPPVQVVAPEINISVPVEAPPITNVTTQAPPPVIHVPPPPAPPGTPVRPTYVPDVQDYYPDVSRRNGEQGHALVKICVDDHGRIATADIATSTGHPMLDAAAIKVAKAFRFKPATSGGRPVESCVSLPVKFELNSGG